MEPAGRGPGFLVPAARTRVTVRALRPVLEVERDGHPVAVRATVAKLLLVLVTAHPRPLHAEEVADVLWPGEPLEAVRGRLDSLVHRLRRALGDDAAAFVSRADGRLALAPDAAPVEVDPFRLRSALATRGGTDPALLAQVDGNLCEAQFPYDEALVDARHRLAGEWLAAARRAGASGARLDTLRPAARALGVEAGLA